MSEVLDDNKFADTAKRLYDTYIITRNGQMIKELDFLGIMKIILMGEAGIYVPMLPVL